MTYNVRDFAHLHRISLATGRSHAGIVLISSRTIRQEDIESQLRALQALLDEHSEATDLRNEPISITAADRES